MVVMVMVVVMVEPYLRPIHSCNAHRELETESRRRRRREREREREIWATPWENFWKRKEPIGETKPFREEEAQLSGMGLRIYSAWSGKEIKRERKRCQLQWAHRSHWNNLVTTWGAPIWWSCRNMSFLLFELSTDLSLFLVVASAGCSSCRHQSRWMQLCVCGLGDYKGEMGCNPADDVLVENTISCFAFDWECQHAEDFKSFLFWAYWV